MQRTRQRIRAALKRRYRSRRKRDMISAITIQYAPLANFAKQYGYEEYVPYVCNLDYVMFGLLGVPLFREKTCFEDVYFFHDTIENNIRMGKEEATREEIIEAAKKASCHEFIMALPEDMIQWWEKAVPPFPVARNSESPSRGHC